MINTYLATIWSAFMFVLGWWLGYNHKIEKY